MKNRVPNSTHYPTKAVQRLANGGTIRSNTDFRDMMSNWQQALQSGNYGKAVVRYRSKGDYPSTNAIGAFSYLLSGAGKKKKTNG